MQIIVMDDLVAPVLTSPLDTATGAETASLSVSTNKDNGTIFWSVTQSATPPSKVDIEAGTGADDNGSISVSTLGVQEDGAVGLVGSTAYYAHFFHRDVSGNESAIVSGDGFTTDAAGDTIAPVLSSPTDVGASTTTGTLGVTTDEDNGTIYWVATTSATPPSKAQVKAGQNHLGAAAAFSGTTTVFSAGTKSKTATGLTANTQYFLHAMHEDLAANQSNVSSGNGLYTAQVIITLSTPGSGTFTIPVSHAEWNMKPSVNGAGGGGAGGAGGQGGAGLTWGGCVSGEDGDNGNNGTDGGLSSFNAGAVVGNGGKGGKGSGSNGANGTATGGDTNTTGGGASGGSGGNGGDGGDGNNQCSDGADGGPGGSGGKGGQAIKTYPAGTFAPLSTVSRVVGSRGTGGSGGNGGAGADSDVGSDGQDGDNGATGSVGNHGSIVISWVHP